jgi:signal transduction histidine kinase
LELVKIAHRNSRRLIEIVNDILDMEKLAAGKMVFETNPIELVTLVNQAIEYNEAFATNLNVHFLFAQFPESACIRADGSRLMQVLTNLMSNAVKFSPAGSEVQLSILKAGKHWRINVKDQGIGIPVAFRSHIFGTFAQAEDPNVRQKGGTGLGLHIAKTMVEKMDGVIGFESEEGKGTLFWISFPAIEVKS